MKEDHIRYRLEKAEESYQAAQLMADNGQWNFCVNRLYYTCFYSAIAMLLKHDITPKTHEGTKQQFSLHFIKNGTVDKEHGSLYTKLFNWRQKGDYGDMFDFSEEQVSPLFEPVRAFLKVVNQHVQFPEF